MDQKTVHNILVEPDGTLTFSFYDGKTVARQFLFFKPEQRRFQDPHTQFYGYTWNGETYVINEKEAAVIRTVYDDYLAGMSISDISRKNESLGHHSKRGRFSRKFILYLLSNPFYTGSRTYPAAYSRTGQDEIVEHDHDGIIDRETFEKAKILREKSMVLRRKAMETARKKGEA